MLFHNLVGKNASAAAGLTLYAWGSNLAGALAITAGESYLVPTSSIDVSSWKQIAAGNEHVLAIKPNGTLWAWGSNVWGQLGDGNNFYQILSPQKINNYMPGNTSWNTISLSNSYTMAIRADGSLWTWGLNSSYQLGDGTAGAKSSPVQIGTSSWLAVAAGGDIGTMAIDVNNRLYHWGSSSFDNTINTLYRSLPTVVYTRNVTSTGFFSWNVVSTGTDLSAAIRSDGRLFVWGSNNFGALGLGDTIQRTVPEYIDTSSWLAVSVGGYTMTAIKSDGTLWTWGRNNAGQIGDGTTLDRSSPVQISTSSWIAIATSGGHSMAIRVDNSLFCWGTGINGQLGNSSTSNQSSPVQVPGNNWKIIAAGGNHSYAIKTDGSLWAWGAGTSGQIGNNSTLTQSSPVQVASGGTFQSWTAVAAGISHGLAVRTDGALFGWGYNAVYGALGDGTTVNKSSPVQIGTSSWTTVASGAYHGIAIRTDGTVWAWGYGTLGQLGDNALTTRSSPVQIGISSPSKIGTNSSANGNLLIDNLGQVAYWGSAALHSDGNGLYGTNKRFPQGIFFKDYTKAVSFTSVAATLSAYAVIDSDSNLYTWGVNSSGLTGHLLSFQSSATVYSPTKVYHYYPDFTQAADWTSISSAGSNFAAINSVGELFVCGLNATPLLGVGGTYQINVPTPFKYQSWTAVGVGLSHSAVIRSDGTLWTTGLNNSGQLGINAGAGTYSSWQQVYKTNISNSWTAVAVANLTTAAIDNLGRLWAWGSGTNGAIGDGTTVNKSSPVQIGIGNSFKAVAGTKADSFIALATNGTVYTWGLGTSGQIGNNGALTVSSPVVLSVTSSWSVIAAGNSHMAAITIDGQLYLWGANSLGQIGDGTTVAKSVPTKLGTSSWSAVALSDVASFAIDTAGRLFSWGGAGGYGLGDTLVTARSSPVQIGTDKSWTAVTASQGLSYAKATDNAWYSWGANVGHSLGLAYEGVLSGGGTIARFFTTPQKMPKMAREDKFKWFHTSGNATNIVSNNNNLYTAGNNTANQFIGQYAAPSAAAVTTAIYNNPVKETYSWTVISTGKTVLSGMGIKSDGSLWAWGANSYGNLGDLSNQPKSFPIKIGTSSWSVVSAGMYATAGITVDGKLFTWGYSGAGLGDGSTQRSSPVQIGTNSWTTVSVGEQHMAGIQTDGTLWTWGYNLNGQIGDGTTVDKATPTKIGSSTYSKIDAGYKNTAAITTANKLFIWGDNTNGQIGDGTTVAKSSPVQIGTDNWAQVSIGNSGLGVITSVGIKTDGSLWGWGGNTNGQIGDYTTVAKSSPVNVGAFSSWSFVDTSGVNTVAITTGGLLYTWGLGSQGVIGNNTTVSRSSPALVNINGRERTSWISASLGQALCYAIRDTGELFGWGDLTGGDGGGTMTARSSPSLVLADPSVLGVDRAVAGQSHNTILTTAGTIYSQGWAVSNGDGSFEAPNAAVVRSSPVQIGVKKSNFTLVASGPLTSYALDSLGNMWAWGSNRYATAGTGVSPVNDSTTTTAFFHNIYSTPTQIGVGTSWKNIFAEPYYGEITTNRNINGAFAIDNANNLYTWGTRHNTLGRFFFENSPIQIGTSSWTFVAANLRHSIGQTVDGTLYTWGYGEDGQLGDGNFYNGSVAIQSNATVTHLRTSPTPVAGFYADGYNSWSIVSAGNNVAHAIDKDGLLWTWGGAGNLTSVPGDSTTNHQYSPVVISGSSWKFVKASGPYVSVGLKTDGSLWTWGVNTYGGIGDGSTINRLNPFRIGYESWAVVSAGTYNTVAIKIDGTLWSWGLNNFGALGDGTTISKSSPVLVSAESWKTVAAGYYGAVAIKIDGSLWAWGYNASGSVGDNTITNRSSIVKVATNSSFTAVWAGSDYYAAIDINGLLYTWGGNLYGCLGNNLATNKSSPVQIGTSSWMMVSADPNNNTTLAITVDGKLFGWGDNRYYQLADGTTVARSSPVQIASSGTFESFKYAGAGTHSYAIRTDGALFAWGTGGVNNGPILRTKYTTPVVVSSPSRTTGVSATVLQNSGQGINTVVKGSDGYIYVAGRNYGGNLGNGNTRGDSNFNAVLRRALIDKPDFTTGVSWTQISAAGSTSAGIRSDGALFVWGLNGIVAVPGTYGKLGIFSGDDVYRPKRIDNNSWNAVSQGETHTVAIRADGSLWTWGIGNNGELGNLTLTQAFSPVQIGTLSSWTFVAAGFTSSYAIAIDGALFAWGAGLNGQLGDNTNIGKSSPVRVGTSSWLMVSASKKSNFAHGITVDKRLFAWGINTLGTLGDGTTVTKSSPVQIASSGTFESWNSVSAGPSHVVAIRSDGALFTWGNNLSGRLGDGTTVNKSSPVRIGTSSWAYVSAGQTHSLAITSDNKLFGWGYNANFILGSVGILTPFAVSSPVQISSGSWKAVESLEHGLGIKTDNSLWAWAYNFKGKMGVNFESDLFGQNALQVISNYNDVGSSVTQIATAASHTAVLAGNDLYVWGAYNGSGSNNPVYTPTSLNNNLYHVINNSFKGNRGHFSFTAVSANDSGLFALNYDGTLYATGVNNIGNLGINNLTNNFYFSTVFNSFSHVFVSATVSSWKMLASGGSHTAAIKSDGSLWTWGLNNNGQLGTFNTVNRSSPVQVLSGSYMNPEIESWSFVSCGELATAAIRTDGALFTWGYNFYGQLGDGTTVAKSSPVKIGTDSWVSVSITTYNAFALKYNGTPGRGTLWGWGSNTTGGTWGDGTSISRSSPVQVGTSEYTFIANSTSGDRIAAIGMIGDLWMAGQNNTGSIGDNSTTSVPTLKNINTTPASSWTMVSLGSGHTAGLLIDGSLYTWGSNSVGQLGDGTTINRLVPTKIGTSSWISVGTGRSFTVAVRSDNTVWAWGDGTGGQLGDNTLVSKSSPVQAVGITNAAEVFSSRALMSAIRTTTNSLYTWGYNTNGELGIMSTTWKSSPVLFAASQQWTSVIGRQSGGTGIYSGSVYTWGSGSYGQIGDGTVLINVSTPAKITTMTNIYGGGLFNLGSR